MPHSTVLGGLGLGRRGDEAVTASDSAATVATLQKQQAATLLQSWNAYDVLRSFQTEKNN